MVATSVVILSHNRLGVLTRNLTRALCDLPGDSEIIVVDNASDDGTREFLADICRREPRITGLWNDKNTGVAAGRNRGFRAARGSFVVALDDDAYPHPDLVRRIPAVFGSHPKAGVLAFRVLHATTGLEQNPHGNLARPVANFHGAGHAIRREVFDAVGYLDERCSFGGEELDFSIRCHSAGYETLYLPDLVVEHDSFLRPGPAGADRRRKWVQNYARVLYKHFPTARASLYGCRFLYMSARAAHLHYGRSLVVQLVVAFLTGMREGLQCHAPVPRSTLLFYSDETLRPEFGNVPIHLVRKAGVKTLSAVRGLLTHS
jgi:GT2 family glycosyltransferase